MALAPGCGHPVADGNRAGELLGGTGFAAAVRLHNVLGFLLIGNAALGAFWYMTTGTIRQYLPEPREFLSLSVRQASYYLRGMFRGEPHPLEKSARQRLNPLQQVTYLMILNVLLPLQMTTGILIWGAERWPSVAGSLPLVIMIHTLGAWLFASFVLMHVYLITTGRTPLVNLKAMVLGYEDVPGEQEGSPELGGVNDSLAKPAAGILLEVPPVTADGLANESSREPSLPSS